MNKHNGHRARLKQRFLDSDAAGFADHELLELLLFYSIPRRNTNDLAHSLIERFGSLHGIANASINELMTVSEIGENSAILLKLMLHLAKKYVSEDGKIYQKFNTVEKLVDYGNQLFLGATNEILYAVMMDNSLNVLGVNPVAIGGVNEIRPIIRTIIEYCVLKRATCVVLLHNHPGGSAEPSSADLDFTLTIERELDIMGVSLIEHIIIENKNYCPIVKMLRDRDPFENNIDLEKFYSNRAKTNKKRV